MIMYYAYCNHFNNVICCFQIQMKLTFQQAARGVNKEVHVNVTDTCPKCQGTKAEPGTRAVKCHHCNGTGMVSMIRVVLKLFAFSFVDNAIVCLKFSI